MEHTPAPVTSLKEELVCLFEERFCITVTESTVFFKDFESQGFDLEDLDFMMKEIAAVYQVDLQGFEAEDYTVEGQASVFAGIVCFMRSKKIPARRYFNLSHLAEVIKRKKWFDPQEAGTEV